MVRPRVLANLVTGFSGAGKTTTIINLLQQRPVGERWAVLLNDFGATGIGPPVAGVVVREVTGGCICCTAQVELRTALVRLLREVEPQRLLIEPSGASRPRDLLRLLGESGIASSVDAHATLCVIDPRQFVNPAIGAREDYLDQVVSADVLVINQSDLAPAAATAKVREAAARLSGRMVIETAHGQVSAAVLDGPARFGR